MITVFDDTSIRNCRGWTRREFLRIGSVGLGGLTLQGVMAAQAQAKTSSFIRDKSVIMLILQGGPPQIETFDPKMQAPADIRSCTGEVKTKLPGITFGGTFPRLAQMAEGISIVRSFASGDATHNPLPILTGSSSTEGVIGAQYARLAGPINPMTAMPTHSIILLSRSSRVCGLETGPVTSRLLLSGRTTAQRVGWANAMRGCSSTAAKHLRAILT